MKASYKVLPLDAEGGKYDSCERFYIRADVILKSFIRKPQNPNMAGEGGLDRVAMCRAFSPTPLCDP